MLERLILESFQRHRRLDVKLGPVTTFVGPSQRGKSSVLRALRWVGLNQPFGARFATWDEEAVSAALKVDGRWVARKWNPKENCYELDGVPYFSLRSPAVPETISTVLNLDPLNFQLQFDPPFWLFETAGEVSRRLNEVVNLGEIDAAHAEAAAAVKRSKAAVELGTERLAAAEAKAAELAWVAAAEEAFAEVETLHAAAADATAVVSDLFNLIADVRELGQKADAINMAVVQGEGLMDMTSELMMSMAQTVVLRDILTDLRTAEQTLDRTKGLDKAWKELSVLRTEGDRAAEDRRQLEELVTELSQAEEQICQSDAVVESALDELRRLTKGRCPACLQPADASRLLSATPTSASGAR